MTRASDDDGREEESRRILRRVREETDPQTGSAAERMAHSVSGHFLGRDADPADRIEVWGTRLGRGASIAAFAILAVWLVNRILAG